MKKKIFDRELYCEGLKQLRVVGIVLLVLFALAAILIPVGHVVSLSNEAVNYGYESNLLRTNYLSMNPLMVLTYAVAAPLLTLKLFSFLNRREASDFYHAIPQTRKCLYISFSAALISWLAVLVVVPGLLSVGLCGIFSKYIALDTYSVVLLSWHLLAAAILVAAAVILAMSLTGTIFTNIVVALLILFLPRLLITVITMSVSSALPYVAEGYQTSFLDYRINLVSGSVFGLLFRESSSSLYSNLAGVYTFLLAAIYLFAGGCFFCRRRSESAGMAAVSEKMQLVFRLTVAFAICLIPIVAIFFCLIGQSSLTRLEVFTLFVLYLVAVLAYLLYELIATRKWRNLLKTLPGLGILALLNIVMLFAMYGYYHYESGIRPEAEDIVSVRLMPEDGSRSMFVLDSYGSSESVDYFRAQEAKAELTDPAVKAVVARALAENIDYYGEEAVEVNLYENSFTQRRTVAIRTGMRTIYRTLLMKKSDIEVIGQALKQVESVRDSYQYLPSLSENGSNLEVYGTLDMECMERIYEVLCEELAAMEFEEAYAVISEASQNYSTPWLMANYYEGEQEYSIMLSLSEQLPLTMQAFYEEAVLHEDPEGREQLLAKLSDPEAYITQFWVEQMDGLTIWDASDALWDGQFAQEACLLDQDEYWVLKEEPRQVWSLLLEQARDFVPENGETCYRVHMEWCKPDPDGGWEFEYNSGYFAFPKDSIPEELLSYFEE